MELTQEEKLVIISIINQCRFTPAEWENQVRPIVMKLQQEETYA